jgi:DNA-binding NtrC family response regulator
MMALSDSGTIDELCAYHWPRNVRELQNLIKRIIFSENTAENIADLINNSKVDYENSFDKKTKEMSLSPSGISDSLSIPASELAALPFKKARKKIVDLAEKQLISEALEKSRWNRSRANKILGISYKTLLSKIRELNIQPSE